MDEQRFTVLGPLMGGKGSRAFLGTVQDDRARTPKGQVRPVVMVFLPDALVSDKDLLAHVREETKVASEIDHINVIGVWGVAELEEGTARVVEFADAESLATVNERLAELGRTLPVPIAAAIVKDACMGAHYAHELGRMETGAPMIHGGLRPATLLVSFQGMAKVTGYGAAVLAEWVRKERGEETAVRDPYTAPEQIFGGRTASTEQTDVYGLGAVLFETLTGGSALGNISAVGDALIRDDITHDQLTGVDPILQDIVVRAMKRKATDRFPSALDMRHALLDTNLCASDQEVRFFMEEIFPPDFPTRVARMNLLASARKKREVTRPAQAIPKIPSPAEATAMLDGMLSTPPSSVDPGAEKPNPPPAAAAPTPANSANSAPLSPSPAATALSVPADPKTAAPEPTSAPPTAAAPIQVAPVPVAPVQVAAVQPSPYANAPPQVVYKTPTWIPIAFAVVVGAAVAFGAVLFLQPAPKVVVTTPVATVPPTPPVEAPIVPPPVEAPASPVDPQPPTKPVNPKPAKPKPPPRPTKGKLEIKTVPAVAIYVDGKKIGVGSGSIEVKAGRHKIKLRDAAKGIKMNQKVRVRGGETKRLVYEIGKGKLLLTAPAGSLVYLDGRKIGKAPLAPYTVYQGSHNLTVKREIGGPQFSRSFRIKRGDEVSMWVEFRAQ